MTQLRPHIVYIESFSAVMWQQEKHFEDDGYIWGQAIRAAFWHGDVVTMMIRCRIWVDCSRKLQKISDSVYIFVW